MSSALQRTFQKTSQMRLAWGSSGRSGFAVARMQNSERAFAVPFILHSGLNLTGNDCDKIPELGHEVQTRKFYRRTIMASDYLLQIEGIKGESKDSKHPNTIFSA